MLNTQDENSTVQTRDDLRTIINDYYLENKVHDELLFSEQFDQFVSLDAMVELLFDARFELFKQCPKLKETQEYRDLWTPHNTDKDIEMQIELNDDQQKYYIQKLEQYIDDNAKNRSRMNIDYIREDNKVISFIPSKIFDPGEIAQLKKVLEQKVEDILKYEDFNSDDFLPDKEKLEKEKQAKRFKGFVKKRFSRHDLEKDYGFDQAERTRAEDAGLVERFPQSVLLHKRLYEILQGKNYIPLYSFVKSLGFGTDTSERSRSLLAQMIMNYENLENGIIDIGRTEPYFIIHKNYEDEFISELHKYQFVDEEDNWSSYTQLADFKTISQFKISHNLASDLDIVSMIPKSRTMKFGNRKFKLYSNLNEQNQPKYHDAQLVKLILSKLGAKAPRNLRIYELDDKEFI